MKEINLGRVLIENRHKRGITQDELAKYMGVTTAAISKWETGTTYPDILMLPRLATFFDITLDELMDYQPQMDQAEIQKWYRRLSEEFAELSFDEALTHCREMVKKYYSCYPFLFQAGSLLVNYSTLAESPEKANRIMEEALELFQRVKRETDDFELGKEALQMEAYCLLMLKRPADVLNVLKAHSFVHGPAEPLLASAYQMLGNHSEAKKVVQVGIYQMILSLMNLMSSYISLCSDDPENLAEGCRRLQSVADEFHLSDLHPGILLTCYITMAQEWTMLGETENALSVLEKYTNLASRNIYPMRLHGDSYFHLLDDWINTLTLGSYPPREESVIRHSITQALTDNPAFTNLAADPRFQSMSERLKQQEEEK